MLATLGQGATMKESTRFYKFCLNVAVLSFYIIALGGLLYFLRCMGVV